MVKVVLCRWDPSAWLSYYNLHTQSPSPLELGWSFPDGKGILSIWQLWNYWDFSRKHSTVMMLNKTDANRADKPDEHGHITDIIIINTISTCYSLSLNLCSTTVSGDTHYWQRNGSSRLNHLTPCEGTNIFLYLSSLLPALFLCWAKHVLKLTVWHENVKTRPLWYILLSFVLKHN